MSEKDFAVFLTKNETMALIETLNHPSLASALLESFKEDIEGLKIKAKNTLKLHFLDDDIERSKKKFNLLKGDLNEL